jgi:hypothetical protein
VKEVSRDNRPSAIRTLYLLFCGRLPLESETGLFILASTLDVILTWYLVSLSKSWSTEGNLTWFVESNPAARYFMEGWGFDGLVFFKFAMVTLVTVICQLIARHKVEVARRVLYFATLMVTSVVAYSVVLLMQHS